MQHLNMPQQLPTFPLPLQIPNVVYFLFLIIFNCHYYVRQRFMTIDSRTSFELYGEKSLNIHIVAYLRDNLINPRKQPDEYKHFHHV